MALNATCKLFQHVYLTHVHDQPSINTIIEQDAIQKYLLKMGFSL
jgi:hypothetical protein